MGKKPTPKPSSSAVAVVMQPSAQSQGAPITPSVPSLESVLTALTTPRLFDLYRHFGCEIFRGAQRTQDRTLKEQHVRVLARQLEGRLPSVLHELGRDELRAVCRAHGLDASPRARAELQSMVLSAAGFDPHIGSVRPPPLEEDHLPKKGQIVHARHRQWLVDEVSLGDDADSPLVRLICLDDDDPGRELEVLWSLELGAQVVAPERQGLGAPTKLDSPGHFGAYLHALKWSAVSSADATLFQAPFRAGIKLMAHQLTPLMKALELPRANLFIADDVGLGKTIEAGLVLQELLLRQQASFVLIVCPASVCLQWQGEMQRRFGLRFEVMTRQWVAYRRQERGFGTNPWSTHNRFVVSHALLRRPEHRDALLHHLGERARRGLLILDEAHIAAPATASKYAVDTEVTRTIRDLAPRFDNRLFLSATPHNGHSNSFSALLEILDPVRFTRGVPVEGRKDLEPIMVRRLKRDLRELGVDRFPKRVLVQLALSRDDAGWAANITRFDPEAGALGVVKRESFGLADASDLELATKLQRYTELCAPAGGRGRMAFVFLQQRLLSSPEALARTLRSHESPVPKPAQPAATSEVEDEEVYGANEDAELEAELPSDTGDAKSLLGELRSLAERARHLPDAKTLALFAWLREHLCPALGLGEDSKASRKWSDRRVLLFTQYADTKRYLVNLLNAAIAHTDLPDDRILEFHGGMGEEARHEVQRRFNAPPESEPARILVATDAAREGVNLQAYCADLFHIDIPWNPARLEQRNGRIDRTLQPADEVRCHYFIYPQRTEDPVLDALVRKVETVRRELGSLGSVILGQLDKTLEHGITAKSLAAVEAAGNDAQTATVEAELEDRRADKAALQKEVASAGARLERSRRVLEVDADSLRGVVEVGLKLAGAEPLAAAAPTSDGRPTYTLPTLDRSWAKTLDVLRPPRRREQSFWEWRDTPPNAVTFHPLSKLNEDAEQLHLAHPFVKRILDRFQAQGFSAHDLTRTTAVIAPDESVVRVVAYARLTLFGHGAARLHDQLVPLAAAWSGEALDVAPYKDRATLVETIKKTERLLAAGAKPPGDKIATRIRQHADALFRAMWPFLEAEADALGVEARQGLSERARKESTDMRALIDRQRKAIDKAEQRLRQGELFEIQDKEQKRQIELDLKHLERRKIDAAIELDTEPAAIEALYDVRMARLTPVGLVVAWPEMQT